MVQFRPKNAIRAAITQGAHKASWIIAQLDERGKLTCSEKQCFWYGREMARTADLTYTYRHWDNLTLV